METTTPNLIKECKSMIASAKIDDALNTLMTSFSKSEKELVMIASKWSELKKNKRTGILSSREFEQERMIVNQSLLDFLEELEQELKHFEVPDETTIKEFRSKKKNAFFTNTNIWIALALLSFSIIAMSIFLPKKSLHEESHSELNMKKQLKEIERLYDNQKYGDALFKINKIEKNDIENEEIQLALGKFKLGCIFAMYTTNTEYDSLDVVNEIIDLKSKGGVGYAEYIKAKLQKTGK